MRYWHYWCVYVFISCMNGYDYKRVWCVCKCNQECGQTDSLGFASSRFYRRGYYAVVDVLEYIVLVYARIRRLYGGIYICVCKMQTIRVKYKLVWLQWTDCWRDWKMVTWIGATTLHPYFLDTILWLYYYVHLFVLRSRAMEYGLLHSCLSDIIPTRATAASS